jgi:hypothetical protein
VSIPFLLDQNPNVPSVGLDSAGGRTRPKGSLWRRSVELRASGAVSLHWQAVFGPAAKQELGVHRIDKRMAYRYYRLAKKRWQRGQRAEAREAVREATSLCPFFTNFAGA